MYLERDAKIILISGSIFGIVWFVTFYILIVLNKGAIPGDTFNAIQIMTFGILSILTLIAIGSFYSLKKEITTQQKFLETHKKTTNIGEKYVKLPYNKKGLYSLIIVSLFGIIAFLYLYSAFVLQPQEHYNQNTYTLSIITFIFVIIFIIILLSSFFILMKRINVPLYYVCKTCPRCSSSDIHKVEYSWWGGLIGPFLVHQVRCRSCGKTYNGVTGTDITQKISLYIIIFIIIITFLELLGIIL